MNWSPVQNAALSAVSNWLSKRDRSLFRLFGYAGTGKTTLAKHFADGLDGTVAYGAFTGKAAHVLQTKGCSGATTIHKLLYQPKEKSRSRLRELEEELTDTLREMTAEGRTPEQCEEMAAVKELRDQIKSEQQHLRKPAWGINPDSPLKNAKLIVIDECSMVDQRMGEDLLSFDVPALVLGDPAQLPPVGGEGYFTKGTPDILLTEIHRQAQDNPILRMAHMVRTGQELRHGIYGTSKVIAKAQVDRDELLNADQVIVGKNATRKAYNHRMRELKGFSMEKPTPQKGDKLICLRNNHEVGLLNGSLWNVNSTACLDDGTVDLDITATDSDNRTCCTAHAAYFKGEEPPFYEIKDHEAFDYGYAITCHKSQGSQYNHPYIFDESGCFRQDARKWLYTAITRAAERVTVVM